MGGNQYNTKEIEMKKTIKMKVVRISWKTDQKKKRGRQK